MTSPSITFARLSTVSDADRDAVLALEAGSFSNPWSPDSFETMLGAPASRLYIARDTGGAVVAFCACWLFDDELHINTVAVRTDLRRRGIGQGLLQFVIADTGAARATLEVRRSNDAAVQLYRGLGFKVTAVREGYYEKPPEDGLILWWNP